MEFRLNRDEEKILLDIARNTLNSYIREGKEPSLPEPTGNLGVETGAFVTLHKNERLRGCIGNMVGTEPLRELIKDMTIAASTQDPRFPKVGSDEIDDIDIEISVLTPLKEVKNIDDIEVGRHGIVISRGWQKGVLLPQVAEEHNWDEITFLKETCLKAGMSPDSWKDPETKIEIFSAQVFGEKDYGK